VSLKSLLERFDSLPLVLLETIVNNCKKAFSEVAAERVLDDMVSEEGPVVAAEPAALAEHNIDSEGKARKVAGCSCVVVK
ncbi:hypothetical protein S83_066677, partial [Arachis hypogaea]